MPGFSFQVSTGAWAFIFTYHRPTGSGPDGSEIGEGVEQHRAGVYKSKTRDLGLEVALPLNEMILPHSPSRYAL